MSRRAGFWTVPIAFIAACVAAGLAVALVQWMARGG